MIDIDEQPSAPELPGAGTLNLYADSSGLVTQQPNGTTTLMDGQIYPERLVLWGAMAAEVLSTGANASVINNPYNSQRHRFGAYLNPGTPGERFGWLIPLSEGDYTANILAVEFTVSGVMSLYIDGQIVGTRSQYNASAGGAFNVTYTMPFSVRQSGTHRFEVGNLASPANASEENYLVITKIWIVKD